MDIFSVASIGLALVEEHAQPLGMSEKPRGYLIDEVYKPVKAREDESRVERLKWAMSAGGDV